MKLVCILCEDSVVDKVRKTGKVMGKDIMKIPLSKRGVEPATHWFCKMSITDDTLENLMYQRRDLISDGKYTIEESNEVDFLIKYDLKRIS